MFFLTAVQKERGAFSIAEHKLPLKGHKSTSLEQQGPTINNLDLPFSSYTLSPVVSSQMKSNSLNRVIKIQPDCTMSEVLAKAEKAEDSKVPFSLSLASKMSKDTRTSLQSVISWAKEIPMFAQLPIEDQIELIKATWSEINTLKLVYYNATCPFDNGIKFQADKLSHLYLTDDQVESSSIKELIKECVASMENIQVDKTELSHLKLIALMNSCK